MNERFCFHVVIVTAGLLLGSCSPALNWRQITVPGAPMSAYFPCRPDNVSRRLNLVAQTVSVGLSSCSAAAQTFAVMAIDLRQSDKAADGQQALRQLAEQNFGGQVEVLPQKTIASPFSPLVAQQLSIRATRPDGKPLQARLLFFSYGAWIFQVAVVGPQLQTEAIDFFFDHLLISTNVP